MFIYMNHARPQHNSTEYILGSTLATAQEAIPWKRNILHLLNITLLFQQIFLKGHSISDFWNSSSETLVDACYQTALGCI